MNNRPLYFVWGPAELGPAYRNDEQTNDRIVLSAEGEVFGWDYRTGLNYGVSKRDTRAGSGYILYSKALEGFDKGILNPFGLQDEAGRNYLDSINMRDYTYRLNKAYNQSIDVTLSRELWDLPGGAMTLAVAGELRRDSARVFGAPLDFVAKNANGSYAIDASGNITKHDLVGETPSGVDKKLKRDISSLLFEVEAPITSTFSLNGAVRADHYDDLKQTTVNPKLAARWQPMQNLVLRSSLSTGFRAPSIMDIQNPTPEVRTMEMDDPVLCPSRNPTIANTGTPVAGFTADQVCNVQTAYWTKSPNNDFLKPEKSRGYSVGMAIEPVKNLSISLDVWGLHLRDQLGAVAIAEIQQNPGKYQEQIIRKADGTIDHIIASQANRGETKIRGVDLAVSYRFPWKTYGTWDAKLDGTYYDRYDFTSEAGGEWLSNIGIVTNDGRYGSAGPNAGLAGLPQINFRWKHTASLGWRQGVWRAQVSQRYSTSLEDVTPRAGSAINKIKAYSQWNLTTGYTGFKNITLGFGVNNIGDVNPPLVSNTLYAGYLTSIADVQGRSYKFTAEYKF
jgi:iron complex outermembrane receptor protein